MAAASNGHLEAAQKLVSAGAALDKQNTDGHNALMFAYNGRAQVSQSHQKLWRGLQQALPVVSHSLDLESNAFVELSRTSGCLIDG